MQVCKYCGENDKHESRDCPEIHNVDNQTCVNCKDETIPHNAGERSECVKFFDHYREICKTAKKEHGKKIY